MELAFVIDPLESIKPAKDSTLAMMRAAAARGHRVFVLYQDDLYSDGQTVRARVRELAVAASDDDWYRIVGEATRALASFDAVLMRKDPPFDMEYVYSTYLLEQAEREGARVYNSPRSLRDFNEKFSIVHFPQFTAPMLVSRREDLLRGFLEEHGDIVVKPLDGMGGTSVFRLHREDPNVGVILETVTHYGRRTVMAQRFIPEIARGDKRILIVDGEPAEYALARVPKRGESRGNLAAGGTGIAQPLSERDRAIATGVAPSLAAQGLLIVGLDVIGDYLTEINVTSPTCMREIFDQTGHDLAARVVDALERRAR